MLLSSVLRLSILALGVVVASSISVCAGHFPADASYRLEVQRTGFHANDAYTAYIELGSPKELTEAQTANLNDLTRDMPETEKIVHSGAGGTIDFTIPINSNDIVLVKLVRSQPAE